MDQTLRRALGLARLRVFATRHPEAAAVIERVVADHLTFLSPAALLDLAQAALATERAHITGQFLEAGCALGGSAIVLARVKRRERPLGLYDVFGMIPPPSEKDGPEAHARYRKIQTGQARGPGKTEYYGYHADLEGRVRDNLRRFNADPVQQHIRLVRGLYQDTMKVRTAVALAHIDCDWYESVRTCLEAIAPHISPGGRFIIDDYYDWTGCRRAVDEYFAGAVGRQFTSVRENRLHIVRHAAP